MSAPTLAAPVQASAGRPAPAAARAGSRWHRLVLPLALVAVYWIVAVVIHLLQTPNLGDPGTLSPTGTGPDRISQLAERIQAQGTEIDRVTSSRDALSLAQRYNHATLFLPTPDYLSPAFYQGLSSLTGTYRVVVVRPGLRSLAALPIEYTGSRWASRTADPACDLPEAVAAGRAGVLHDSYAALDIDQVSSQVCYSGGLIEARLSKSTMDYFVVGATDPFRNSRIGEVGNAALAQGLLTAEGPVIWIDVHSLEPVPPGDTQLTLPRYSRDNQDRTSTGDSLIDAFPALLWVGLIGALVVGLLVAFAAARRLGPPVAEPLPVLVPSTEVVSGRARLLDRIGAHATTFTTLRGAAIRRLNRALNPFSGTAGEAALLPDRDGQPPSHVDTFVNQVATRVQRQPGYVRELLYGTAPDDETELAAAVYELDQLVERTLRGPSPPGATPDDPVGAPPSQPPRHDDPGGTA